MTGRIGLSDLSLVGALGTVGLKASGTAGPTMAAKEGAAAGVTIQDRAFSPAKISIKAGDTVVWTNKDNMDHTVTADDGSWGSGTLKNKKGENTFSHTFKKAGKFPYACSLHPRMKGVVTVE